MMLPTHILAGGTVALLLSVLSPSIQVFLVFSGMLSAVLPDLDMFFEHRKTLHRPVQFTGLFALLLGIYTVTGSPIILVLAVVLASLGLHSVSEILAQGKTMNPELEKDERCVFNHVTGEWIEPLRKIQGASPGDMVLALTLAVPLFLTENSLIVSFTFLVLLTGLIHFLLNDWITKSLLSEYDRFSEAIQNKIGYGPELEKD